MARQTVVPALGEVTITAGSRTFTLADQRRRRVLLREPPGRRYTAVLVFKGGRCRVTIEVPASTAPVIRLGIIRCNEPEAEPEDRQP